MSNNCRTGKYIKPLKLCPIDSASFRSPPHVVRGYGAQAVQYIPVQHAMAPLSLVATATVSVRGEIFSKRPMGVLPHEFVGKRGHVAFEYLPPPPCEYRPVISW